MTDDSLDVEDLDKELSSEFGGNILDTKKDIKVPIHKLTRKDNPTPRSLKDSTRFEITTKQSHYYENDKFEEFTGIDDVDRIITANEYKLKRHNQLVMMWGCRKCWMRGTKDCPYDITIGHEHPHGYCTFAIKSNLIKYKLMHTPNGMKHIRNINIGNVENMLNHYTGRLQSSRQTGKLTKEEVYLLKNVLKMQERLGDMLNKAIQQDEGTKITHGQEVSADYFNKLFDNIKDVEGKTEE